MTDKWTLSFSGTLEELEQALSTLRSKTPAGGDLGTGLRLMAATQERSAPETSMGIPAALQNRRWLEQTPTPYSWRDVAAFAPSPAVYFMDGYSDARIRIRGSNEEIFLSFWDRNTTIAASAPRVFEPRIEEAMVYTPAPEPLPTHARLPEATPDAYKRSTSQHLMQVISMNMKSKETDSRLLIGLPYAEKYPELFFRRDLFGETRRDISAASYGVVQSLTEFAETNGERAPTTNGYPARSFFAIYHLIETPIGPLFNKRATQMELQPSGDGKLALKLPPIPFKYSLINPPIPLYQASDPDGQAVADLVAAHHEDAGAASAPTRDSWPLHQPDLSVVKSAISRLSGG